MADPNDDYLETAKMMRTMLDMNIKSNEDIGNRLRISEQKCELLEAENERITGLYEGLKTSFERQSAELAEKDRKIGQLEERMRSMTQCQDLLMEMVKSAGERGLLLILVDRFVPFLHQLSQEQMAVLMVNLHACTPEYAAQQHTVLSRIAQQLCSPQPKQEITGTVEHLTVTGSAQIDGDIVENGGTKIVK